MRKLTDILSFGLIAVMTAISSCSADLEPDRRQTPEENPLYISFRLSQPGETINSGSITRANVETSAEPAESRIQDLIGVLVDPSADNAVVGMASSDDSNVIISQEDNATTAQVIMNFGSSALFQRKHTYKLYVFANLSGNYSSIKAKKTGKISDVGGLPMSVAAFKRSDISSNHIPMTTTTDAAANVKVWLAENTEYPITSPYIVKIEDNIATADGTSPATLQLTPLQACIYFNDESLTHDITYSEASGETSGTTTYTPQPELSVTFKQMNIKTLHPSVFLHEKNPKSSPEVSNTGADAYGSLIGISLSTKGKLAYIPENIPAKDSNGKLTYSKATYIEMVGILGLASGSVINDVNVRKALNGEAVDNTAINGSGATGTTVHPTLYYYDDGNFQSGLTVAYHNTNANSNWKAIDYDSGLGGYPVKYRHAIRHAAGADDGKYDDLEYAVVRNHIYQIGIKSVSSLPHPFDESDETENSRRDISLRIVPQEKWIYHRGGFLLEL